MALQLHARHLDIHPTARIAEDARISAEQITIGADTVIASGVRILCDELTLGVGCRIMDSASITCPRIAWQDGASAERELDTVLNEHFELGRHAAIGKRAVIAGQGFSAGEFLWLRDDVLIGGGGSQGPDSYCTIGAHVTIVERCFLNVSERVRIGDHTALSRNVVLLTHGAWQPALEGYAAAFAPVSVGAHVTVYFNSVLLPGVSVGDHSTIAAGAVVSRDIPPHCLAGGIPARVLRENYPTPLSRAQQEELVRDVLRDYALTLPPKGLTVVDNQLVEAGWLVVEHEGREWRIRFGQPDGHPTELTLDFGPAASVGSDSAHFDLQALAVQGRSSPLMEDVRDYLRRRAIRFSTGEPFRTLPLANLKRLRSRAQG